MAVPNLKYASGNSASTTLSSSMSDSATSTPLTSDTNFSAKSGAGMVIVDEGQSSEELSYATGKVGSSLTTPLANRGLEGGSPQAHDSGATVKGIMTAGMWNDLIDTLLVGHNDSGSHKSFVVDGTSSDAAYVRLAEDTDNGTNYVGLKAPASITASFDLVLPDNDGGANQVLKTDGSGVLSWVDQSSQSTDGWLSASDTWTYASASTFTIAGADRTAIFTKGTRIKLTQTTAKYFIVKASSFSTDTTVTVYGGTDYTLANAAITSPYYSYAENPQGFPTWFTDTNLVIAMGGSGSLGSISYAVRKVTVRGTQAWVRFSASGTLGGSATTDAKISSLPLTILNADTNSDHFGGATLADGTGTNGGFAFYSSGTEVILRKYNSSNYSTSGTGRMSTTFTYEF